jgi:hypothetical protein
MWLVPLHRRHAGHGAGRYVHGRWHDPLIEAFQVQLGLSPGPLDVLLHLHREFLQSVPSGLEALAKKFPTTIS